MPLRQRDHDPDRRPALRLGADDEASSHVTDPLLQADQAEAAASRLGKVESAPVVTNRQHEIGLLACHGHPRLTGARVHGGILQRFLGHPVDAEGDVGGHGAQVVIGLVRDADVVAPIELAAVTPQSTGQARVLQNAGMKLMREVPDRLRQLDGARVELGDLTASVARGIRGKAVLENADINLL